MKSTKRIVPQGIYATYSLPQPYNIYTLYMRYAMLPKICVRYQYCVHTYQEYYFLLKIIGQ